jgi:hypothetical protein
MNQNRRFIALCNNWLKLSANKPFLLQLDLSPIFLRIQIQLMRLLVGLLVGQLLPSFFILWYDLPTNSLCNYPTNNRISWIWMRKKIGL